MTDRKALFGKVQSGTHLRREAYAMSLYVSIVLLSALSIFDDAHPPGRGDIFLLVLGTTVGLVLAHALASWISTVISSDDDGADPDTWDLLKVQVGGAIALTAATMVPIILAPTEVELPAARLTVVLAIVAQVFVESRRHHSTRRTLAYTAIAFVAGISVAWIKGYLGHPV